MAKKTLKPRLWWLDIARSLAVASMCLYHTMFYGNWMYGWTWNIQSAPTIVWQKSTLMLFLFVSGISASISAYNTAPAIWIYKQTKRCLLLILIALSITAVSMVAVPTMPIYFGVIHCIVIAQLLFIVRFKPATWLLSGICILILSIVLPDMPVQNFWLLPLGSLPIGMQSIDYVPLLPWLSVLLFGRSIGTWVRHNKYAQTNIQLPSICTLLGRYALIVYIIHIPIIASILWVYYNT